MLVLCELVLNREELMVQNVLRVDVFNQDPEALSKAVHSLLELEIRRDGQLNSQNCPSNWQYMRGQVQAWELVHTLVNVFAHLRETDQLADFLRGQIVEALPREFDLLDFLQNSFRNSLKLPQRRLRRPHLPVDHLAELKALHCQAGPATLQYNLEDRADQTSC